MESSMHPRFNLKELEKPLLDIELRVVIEVRFNRVKKRDKKRQISNLRMS